MSATPATDAVALSAPSPGSRRAEIALVAGEEFTRRGYHSTRVEHIAERLSVTPGALYRHVPGKYEIFRDAVFTLLADLDTASGSTPAGDLDELVTAVTDATMVHRSRAALYRWQGRHLSPADREIASRAGDVIRARIRTAVLAHRGADPQGSSLVPRPSTTPGPSLAPDPSTRGSRSAAGAILSTIASLGDHRIELTTSTAVARSCSAARLLALSYPAPLAESTDRALRSRADADAAPPLRPPHPDADASVPPRLRRGAATREAAVTAAIARFHRDGYDDVSMETIGGDAGVAASALYRHFSGKTALLTAAVDRAAAVVEQTLDEHAALRSHTDDPAAILSDLLDGYVDMAFSHGSELVLYYSELGTLTTDDRQRLRAAQRRQLSRWTGLVRDAIPGADATIARLRVQAALAVVLDGARVVGRHPAAAGRYRELARIPLLGVTSP